MIMISETPERLRVSLNEPELSEFGLTFSMLDYSHQKTKQLLNSLLIKASRSTSFRLTPGKMVIEAFPWGEGGCTIYFTIHKSSGRVFRKKKEELRLYSFRCLKDLLDCAALSFPLCPESLESELYKNGEEWILAIWGGSTALCALLSEFGNSVSSDPPFSLLEQSQKICSGALTKLAAPFKNNKTPR